MSIEIVISEDEPQKTRGDLLENISERLLKSQNYEVEKELRNTGAEIDLLCKNSVNNNKRIYVECKAYRDKKIDAPTIFKTIGVKIQKEYEEAWIISTSEYGKDAKGIIEEEMRKGNSEIIFYTPDKIIESLVKSNNIESLDISRRRVSDFLEKKGKCGKGILIVSEEGVFWVFEYILNGDVKGVIVTDASNSEILESPILLDKLSKKDSSFNGLDFNVVFSFKGIVPQGIGKLVFDKDYYASMMDTGVKFTHPRKSSLNVDDVFVFQDIQEVNEDLKINSSKFIDMEEDIIRVVIFGDELSGKTSLAHKLQREFLEKGKAPVYILASSIKNSKKDDFEKMIIRNLKKQFSIVEDSYIENIKNDIVLIIDDYHKIKINEASLSYFNEVISGYGMVFVFSCSSYLLKMTANRNVSDSLSEFSKYKINEYGYKLRDDLIEKWLVIGQNETINDESKHRRMIEISNMVNKTVGRNFVPTYPIYVLTLLQSFEATTAKIQQGSAYAEFYNYLITHALGSSGVKPSELHLYFSFLSDLSYFLFLESVDDISEDRFLKFHSDFCKKKIISVSYIDMREVLLEAKILKCESGNYIFNHNYIYYFFVARFFSENITDFSIQEKISSIIDRVYLVDFSNIMIFLVHFSKDKFIFDKILEKARELFSDISSISFEEGEFSQLNSLIKKELVLVMEDKDPKDARRESLEVKDAIEERGSLEKEDENKHKYDERIRELDIFGKINLSFKMIEILGQISKNYYGALDGDVKIEILEEAYELGLRSMNKLMRNFEEYSYVLKDQLVEIMKDKNITSKGDIDNVAGKMVFDFAVMISFSFLAKISNSVASKDLFDVFKILYEKNQNISRKMIDFAVKLDFVGGLDVGQIKQFNKELSNNNVPAMLLKLFVMRYLYKFGADHDKKQAVCKILKISLEKQKKMLLSSK